MATNIQSQSQTELKSFLEERVRIHFPAANNQEIVQAVEVAMGQRGHLLRRMNDQQIRQDQQSQNGRQDQSARQDNQNARQGQNAQNGRQDQRDQQSQNDQRGQQNRDQLVRDGNQLVGLQMSIDSVRDAAISAAQSLPESNLKMAAVACAWASHAAISAQAEQLNQNQQRAARN